MSLPNNECITSVDYSFFLSSQGRSCASHRRYRLRIQEIDALLKDDQENEELLQERYFVNQAIDSIEYNSEFLSAMQPPVERGEANWLQHLVIKVGGMSC